MIEHAIGPGRDVFIEPDTKRRLSDARAERAVSDMFAAEGGE